MDEFDELREAWEKFTAPFWDEVERIKDAMARLLDKILERDEA